MDGEKPAQGQGFSTCCARPASAMGVPEAPRRFPCRSMTISPSAIKLYERHPQVRNGRQGGKRPDPAPRCGTEVKDKLNCFRPCRCPAAQQQRLLHRPQRGDPFRKVILMDEPCSALDPILDRQGRRKLIEDADGRIHHRDRHPQHANRPAAPATITAFMYSGRG